MDAETEVRAGDMKVMYEECERMLQDMEGWVEERMDDDKERLQARILIHKVFEARFLLERSWKAADTVELEYLVQIVARVWKLYDPHGEFEGRVRQIWAMVAHLNSSGRRDNAQLGACYNDIQIVVNKRDEYQLWCIWDALRQMCAGDGAGAAAVSTMEVKKTVRGAAELHVRLSKRWTRQELE